MKKVALIDLYDQDIKEKLSTNNDFKYTLYIFNETSQGYELQKKVEDLSSESLAGIKYFYLSLPTELLNFRILELPFVDRKKLHKIIPFELSNLILSEINSIVYDFTALDSSENGNKILVSYIDKKIIKDIIERFKFRGIDIYVITSVELRHILEEKKENIASLLISPQILSEEEKIKTAASEIEAATINLRTGEFAYTRDIEKSGRMFKLMLLLLICLSIVINGALALRIITSKNEISSLKDQMRGVYSSLFPADKKIADELYQMKSHMKNLREKADILIGVNPLELMVNISAVKPKGIIFEEISLDREVITLKGETASMNDLDALKKSLSEKYSDVSASDIKPLSESKILFTLIIKDKL